MELDIDGDYVRRVFSSHFRWTPIALAGLGALTGCKAEDPGVVAKDYPARMARGECDALMACACPDNNYEGDLDACFFDRLEAYTDANNLAFSAGLAYDPQCPSRQLEALDDLGCGALPPSLPAGICAPQCSAWHGSSGAGQPCEVVVTNAQAGVAFSTCAQGLSCVADFCVDPCGALEAPPAVGQPCPDLLCEDGAVCDATTDVENPVCVDLPGTGDPCFQGLCDPSESVCVPEANVCGVLPGLGEPCEQGACQPGAYCSLDDICEPSPPLVCGMIVDVDNESGTGDTGDETGTDDGTTDTGGPDDPPDMNGTYLFAMETSLGPGVPLQFVANVDVNNTPGEVPFAYMDLQPLSLDIGSTTSPREFVGSAISSQEFFFELDGTFVADMGDSFLVLGEANPITGETLGGEVTYIGQIIDADMFCGSVVGVFYPPIAFDLEGSTFAAIRLDDDGSDPGTLPLNFPTACP